MLTASARPDPNAPFARAEIIVRGLAAPPGRPEFQLRRSNVDYIEPNLDLTGWTRSEVMLLPLDAWWDGGDHSFHLLISGLLCQYIDPGPLKLRLPGQGGEIDLFWPEDISVYDDGMLAAHARVLADTVRVVGSAPASAKLPEPAPPPPPPPPAPLPPGIEQPAQASPWRLPATPAPVVRPKRRPRWATILVPVVVGAAVIGAVASRHERPLNIEQPRTEARIDSAPPRGGGIAVQPRRADPGDEPPANMRAALDRTLAELTAQGRRSDFDPFLSLRPASEIIGQVNGPEALLRYGAAKLEQREPSGADRLFEEATRPRFGPAQNRPYPPAFVARGLLYDPSMQHDFILPVTNAGFAEGLYRRAIASGDADVVAAANRHLQRLAAWQAQHGSR